MSHSKVMWRPQYLDETEWRDTFEGADNGEAIGGRGSCPAAIRDA